MIDRLWKRRWRVVCGGLDVTDIDLSFEVGKSLKPEPNTAALTLYNLSKENRAKLSEKGAVNVSIEAGYANETDKPSLIFIGPLRSATHTIAGPDIVTLIESADSQKELGTSRFKLAAGPKTSAAVVLKEIAKSLKVKTGHVNAAAAKLAASGKILFPVPTVFASNSARALSIFCASAGLEWSIQDGELQILNLGAALDMQPYVLNSGTGLIGSPSIDKDGIVSLRTLLLHGIRPGSRVLVDSEFVKGVYRVQECSYSGDTRGEAWFIDMVCKLPGKK